MTDGAMVPAARRSLGRRLRDERGYTLTELLAAMSIMLVVITTIAGVFVSGSNAEVDLRQRFEAQNDARIALERFRREVHNACSVSMGSPAGSAYAAVTLYSEDVAAGYTCTVPNTWCAVGSGSKYGLYRKPGASCDSSGVRWAYHLTTNAVFTYIPPSAGTLPRVGIDMPIDQKPTDTRRQYRLQDAIAARNYLRS